MTTLNFPAAPASGATHNAANGLQYVYDGVKWTSQGAYASGLKDISKLDSIASQFNGTLTSFNLTVGSVGVNPLNAESLIISLNGVVQEPQTSYTVNSETGVITFTSAPTAGTTFFGIIQSRLPVGTASIGTLGDGAVSNAKIVDGAVNNAKVSASAAIEASKLSFTQTGGTARSIDNKLKDLVSVKDFGAKGDGTTDDTTAIKNAITALRGNLKGGLYFPAGKYLITQLNLNSIRGMRFVGENTTDTYNTQTVIAAFPVEDPDLSNPAYQYNHLINLRSCGNLLFEGIAFEIYDQPYERIFVLDSNPSAGISVANAKAFYNATTSTQFKNPAIVDFVPGTTTEAAGVAGSNYMEFKHCAFLSQTNATAARANVEGLYLKNAGHIAFDFCWMKDGSSNRAIRLGADKVGGNDPDNGNATLGDCGVNNIDFNHVTFNGDIQRVNGDRLAYMQCVFAKRHSASTTGIANLTLSGSKQVREEYLLNCMCDNTGISDFSGTFFDGSDTTDYGGVTVINCQPACRNTLFSIKAGDAFFSGNKPLLLGTNTNKIFVKAEKTAGHVKIQNTNIYQLIKNNADAGSVTSTLFKDERKHPEGIVYHKVFRGDTPLTVGAYGTPGRVLTINQANITEANPGVLTSNGHGFLNGDRVKYTSNGTNLVTNAVDSSGNPLPQDGTVFFVVNKTDNTFQLAQFENGAALQITNDGNDSQTFTDQTMSESINFPGGNVRFRYNLLLKRTDSGGTLKNFSVKLLLDGVEIEDVGKRVTMKDQNEMVVVNTDTIKYIAPTVGAKVVTLQAACDSGISGNILGSNDASHSLSSDWSVEFLDY